MLCGGSRRRQGARGMVRDESGAVLVFSVVIMAVLLMFAALAIDLPMQMNERRTAQNAADHAALSASWAECTGGDPVAAAVVSAQENGYATSDMTLTHLGGTTFEARVDTASQAIFSKILGFDVFAVSTQAIAECVTSSAGGSAVFAAGDTCSSFGKDQIDIPGATHTVYGGDPQQRQHRRIRVIQRLRPREPAGDGPDDLPDELHRGRIRQRLRPGIPATASREVADSGDVHLGGL